MKLRLPSGREFHFREKYTPGETTFEHDNPDLETSMRKLFERRERKLQAFENAFNQQMGPDATQWELVESYVDSGYVKWSFQKRPERTRPWAD